MANTAVLANDTIVDAENMTDEEFLQLQIKVHKDKTELTGIFCGHTLFPRRGNSWKVNHFVHYSNGADCQYENKGESDQHKALKFVIQETAVRLGFDAKVENRLNSKAISDVSIISESKHLVVEVQLASQTHASYVIRDEHRKNANTETVWLTTDERNLNIYDVNTILMRNVDSRKYLVNADGTTTIISPSNLEEFKTNILANTRLVMYTSDSEAEVELNVEQLVKTLMSPENQYVCKNVIFDRKLKKAQAAEAERLREASNRNKIHSKLYRDSISGEPTNLLELIAAARNKTEIPVKVVPEIGKSFKYVPVKYRDRVTERYTTESLKDTDNLLLRPTPEGSTLLTWANPNCTCAKTSPEPNYQNLTKEDYNTVCKAVEALKKVHGDNWCHREDKDIFNCIVTDTDGVHKPLQDLLMLGYFDVVEDIRNPDNNPAVIVIPDLETKTEDLHPTLF